MIVENIGYLNLESVLSLDIRVSVVDYEHEGDFENYESEIRSWLKKNGIDLKDVSFKRCVEEAEQDSDDYDEDEPEMDGYIILTIKDGEVAKKVAKLMDNF